MRDNVIGALATLSRLCRWSAGIGLIMMVGLMTIVLAARYFSVSVPWADELARIAFVWTIALGASAGVHNRAHFALTFFVDQATGSLQQWIARLLALLGLTVLLLFLIALSASVPIVLHSTLPATGLSRIWMQGPMVMFAVLSILFMFGQILSPIVDQRRLLKD